MVKYSQRSIERSQLMEDVRAAIAENITELRQNASITQSKLADILNYSDKAVSKWERAEAVPDITVLKQLADYFGVSVDYLLTRKHDSKEIPGERLSKIKRKNRFIVASLSVMLVWFITMISFTVFAIAGLKAPWCVFIIALPTSSVVALVFNCIWGKKRLNFLIITVLAWTLLLAVHVAVFAYGGKNLWQLYLVGVPTQLIIVLSSCIKFKKR